MSTLTITIPDDRLLKLKEIAARFRVSPEDLVRVSLEEILSSAKWLRDQGCGG